MRLSVFIILLLSCSYAKSSVIEVSFSGVIKENYFDLPVDTVVSASFTYDTDADYRMFNTRKIFNALSASISIGSQSASISKGYISIFSNNISFDAGSALGIARTFGDTEDFSNLVNGIWIGGLGFNVNGIFTPNVLPTSTDLIYGREGNFYVNRSTGTLYDVNSASKLRMPPNPQVSASTPSTPILFGIVLFLLFLTQRLNAVTTFNRCIGG